MPGDEALRRGRRWKAGLVAVIGIVVAAGLAFAVRYARSRPEFNNERVEPAAIPQGNPEQWTAEGLSLADRLATSFPESPDALDLAARFQQRFGQPETAARYWERCIALNPRSAHACFCLGSAAWEQGDFDKAVTWLEKALAIDPSLSNAPVILAEALLQQGRPQDAATILTKAEAATPQSMRHFLLGQARLQLKEYEKARDSFEAAVALEPDYAKARYGLIVACNRLGDSKRAQEHQSAFLKLNEEENRRAGDARSARRDPAADEIRQATARLAFDSARLYAARGDAEESQRLAARAAALDPANPGYRQALEGLRSSRAGQ